MYNVHVATGPVSVNDETTNDNFPLLLYRTV